MIFKDDLDRDLETFLELKEFAEPIEIDGVKLSAQITHSTADKSTRQNENFDGLHGDFLTVYFKTAEYCAARKRLPRNFEWIFINGKRYDVVSSTNQQGIAKIICAAYRQNTVRI